MAIRDWKNMDIALCDCIVCHEVVGPQEARESRCSCRYTVCVTCVGKLTVPRCLLCRQGGDMVSIKPSDGVYEVQVDCPKCDWSGTQVLRLPHSFYETYM